MGTNLHTFFFKEDGLEDLIEVIGVAVLWFIGSVMVLSYLVDHPPFETLRKIDETIYSISPKHSYSSGIYFYYSPSTSISSTPNSPMMKGP